MRVPGWIGSEKIDQALLLSRVLNKKGVMYTEKYQCMYEYGSQFRI